MSIRPEEGSNNLCETGHLSKPLHRLVSGPFTRVAYALTKRKIGRVV